MFVSLEQLEKIFYSAFGKKVTINEHTVREDIIEWDSLNHLNLIVEIEDQLNIKLSKEEIEQIDSIKKIIEFLKNK